ncbi:hypothetical protein AB0C27_48385 [Nonomuraea sp. NPDC048882]|uniref:hypothetical protein n=1 Tax=Nonomuraea sp. NPDC048882 TaxID=3154347 RepID=UPI0033E1256B
MTESFVAAIDQALHEPEPSARVDGIKLAVSRQLEGIERGLRIKHTEYFNNSIAPDMIVEWPREDRKRFVFLRANQHPKWLEEDVKIVGQSHPIIVTLQSTTSADPENGLQQAARGSDTLVTDPVGVQELVQGRERLAVALLSQAVLRGGRGLLGHDEATNATTVLNDGFLAAERGAVLPTRNATALFAKLLADEQAGRMTRVLQSVWEGHGAPPADFPGRRDLSGRLTDNDIAFLVENLTTDDAHFWRRIGRALTLDQLSRLSLADPSVNLQRLVASNADRLTGKAMRLFHEPQRVDEVDVQQVPRWLIARGCLTLRGEDWSLYIAPNSVDQLPRPEQRDGIPVSRLRARSLSRSVTIGHLELTSGDRIITYASRGMENVINDDRLIDLAESPDVLIHRATVVLSGGRRIVCDFTTLTAQGHTSATFPLDELIGSAFLLLKDIDHEATLAAIRDLTTAPTVPDAEQLSLDLDL